MNSEDPDEMLQKVRIFFIGRFTNPPTVIFQKVEKKKNSKNFFFILSANKILFVLLKKNEKILRFCLCIFESDTVKSDCPMQDLKI